jgi:amino acid adenylation domain-containing protein
VAHVLRSRGIGRDQAVGVLADRSAAAITAIWGVLRAGAAYLPLDVAHPDARLAGLLADADVPVCLVERPHDRRDIVPAGCEPIVLDDLDHGAEVDFTDADVQPDDLAYVMYTSGSTGRPKGVEIEHRALLNYVVWATREMSVDAGTRLPLLTSLAFDVSCTSIFLPLLAGGTLLLPSGPPDHTTLRELLQQESGATALSVTPSLLELICELDLRPAGVRVILSAGELLTRVAALRAQAVFGPDCLLLNTYGPTETTIECSIHPFDADRDTAPGVPIGVPTDNSTAHLLDSQRRFVKPGELGELYLGGAQLARGYRGRPDLTRDRFVRLADGSRVYRSGDIARLLPSGELEFAERADDQVKVLGHRIEPAEIAQTLEGHPTVARAAVVVRNRGSQTHKVLCAYVIGNGAVDTADLEEYLSGRLPRYMLPATVTVVPEIPQTINGKIDVRALPDPFAGTEPETAGPVEADPVGEAVAAVWASTLGVPRDQLHADADFHHLGGNSLMMLSMVAGVCRDVVGGAGERRFMERLGDIIREPTIVRVTEIAREVRDGDETAAGRTRVPNSVPA